MEYQFICVCLALKTITNVNGEVAEWLKVLAWKVSVPHKGTAGSNPALSAATQQ